MAVYVGNLPSIATDDQISRRFGQHGNVHSVALINDRETGRFCMSRLQISDGYDLLGLRGIQWVKFGGPRREILYNLSVLARFGAPRTCSASRIG